MKKFRRYVSAYLILILLFGLLPAQFGEFSLVHGEETTEKPVSGTMGNVQWTITEDTQAEWDLADSTPYKLTLTGTGNMEFGENADPPWYMYGYYETITSISIAEGITNIPYGAFYGCASLKSINLPDSITEIGGSAFGSCSLLETVVCGSGLKKIGEMAFYMDVSLVSVQFQEGLEIIEEYAFADCKKLSDITFPNSLTFLGKECFRGAVFKSANISENMSTIESSIFRGNNSLQNIQCAEGNENFRAVDNVLYEQQEGKPYRVIAYAPASPSATVQIQEGTQIIDKWSCSHASNLSSVTLPSTLKEIKEGAFSNCDKLSEISIPDHVEIVETRAFHGCGLTKVTVGSGLKSMPGAIFKYCLKLSTVIVSEENPYMEVIDNVVYNKEHTICYLYPAAKPDKEYHILDTVEVLAECCLSYVAIEELYMPKNLVRLEMAAVFANTNLNSIYFQGNAPALGLQSLYGNGQKLLIYRVSSTTGWDGTGWSSFSFAEWDPDNVMEDEGTFEGISWKYQGDIGRIQFTGTGKIPDFTEEEPAPWNAYMDKIQTIEADGITEIGDYAFSHAEKLLRFETGKLKIIGDYAFADCGKLLLIDIAGTETIGTGAFQYDASIQGELVLNEVVSIGAEAFEGCAALTAAVLGGHIETLEERTFAGCTSMSDFMIPDSASVIKAGAFWGSGLRTVNIPAGVHTIETQAFKGNTGLEKVYFYGGIPKNWAEDSFQECERLTICYRKLQSEWESLSGSWHGIPLQGLERFYTERRDHYSFANSAVSFGYPAAYRIPRQRYVDILNSIVSGTYYYAVSGNWSGSCYGMAGSTLEFYENPEFDAADYGQSVENLYDLAAPRDKNAALTKLIEAYQISQNQGAISGCGGILSKNMGKYLKMIQKTEAFERSGGLSVDSKAEPILLALYSRYGSHTVIPVSVDQAENGDFRMKVYDPNEPGALQTLIINKDLKGISYKFYTYASYLDYSVIAAAMSGVELHSEAGRDSLYLSIDKKNGTVEDKDGKGIDEIEGAYEQKLFQVGQEDVFSGIRSFVLPEGSYQLSTADDLADTEESVTFYLASEEKFAEITSSDEHAVLEVNQSATETQQDNMELVLKSESTEEETARLTLINEEGMERTLEVEGSNATVIISGDDMITVQAPEEKKVTIDGQEMEVENGQASGTFASSAGEEPYKTKDFQIEISCDDQNRLNGAVNLAVISGDRTQKDVTITAFFLTKDGKQAASYSQEATLNPGCNFITLVLEELETFFEEKVGEVKLSCEMEIRDGDGETFRFKEGELTVTLTKQDTEEPEPGAPGPEKPEDPGPEEPEEPGPEDTDVPVEQIKVNKKTMTLGAGESFSLEVSVFPGNASNKTVNFQAMNDRIEVTKDGKITGKKPGISYVLVKAGSQKQEIVTVTVKKAPEFLTLNAQEKKLNPGEGFQIEWNLPPDTASHHVSYSTSDDSVASVSAKGMVTAGKEGKAVITVETFNGKKAELLVIVKLEIAVKEVKVPVKKLILGEGERCMLGASVLPMNVTDKTLFYEASNNKVSVSAKGEVKAKKRGTSRITIRSSNGKTAKVIVRVKKAPGKITLNASKRTLKRGRRYQLKVKLPINTASHSITYSSNKKSVASVSSKGKITAKKKGKAVITAKTYNGKKASIKITVK